ncbi:MAG: hypothetical protein HZC42_14465, partial [Candidatus Eisenbacteria bacterium]|nr:hypothetical protein [Candidatus Eisenbacteria bacterium]
GARLDNQGTVTVDQGLTLSKAAAAHSNSGTLTLGGGNLTITQSGTGPSFTNTGTLTVNPGRTLTVTLGTFNQDAGTLAGGGAMVVSNATVAFNTGFTLASLTLTGATAGFALSFATADFALSASSSTLNGPGTITNSSAVTQLLRSCAVGAALVNEGTLDLRGASSLSGAFTSAPGSTLHLEGDGTSGGVVVTVASGFTNNGTIELTSSNAGYGATLNLSAGTLLNPAGRTIAVLAGAGGGRTLGARLDNQGTVTVDQGLTLSKAAAAHSNSGTLTLGGGNLTITQSGTSPSFTNTGTLEIGAGRTCTVTSGTFDNAVGGTLSGAGTLNVASTSFSSSGSINPGTSPGILSIIGAAPLGSSSTINIELGGATAGTGYDRLAVSGAIALDGTLNISLINSFVPTPGQSFQVMTFASRSGGFAGITGLSLGGGLSLEPRISGTDVVLVTVGQTWVQLLPLGTPPLPRDGHSAVHDAGNNRMTVFGGRGDGGPLNDVWVLTGADGAAGTPGWIQLTPAGGPPPARANHSAVYDPGGNRMIVFGGDDATGPTPGMFNDVWVLSNANGLGGAPAWISLAPTGGPPAARTGHSAVYDAATDRMVVFGGDASAGGCGGEQNDVWALSDASGVGSPAWTQLAPTGGPPSARTGHQATYDAVSNRMTVLGGLVPCGASNLEVWVLGDANGVGSPAWTQLSPGGTPPSPWTLHRAVYDPVKNSMTVFGGAIGGTRSDTVQTLTGANGLAGAPIWTDLSPTSGPPPARTLHSAAPAGQRMIAFGGLSDAGRLGDVWVLEETQGRVVEVPPVEPPARGALTTGFSRPPAPNPGRGATSFSVSVASRQSVEISVWDLAGRRIVTLYRGRLEPGEHAFEWRGAGASGAPAASGLYFLRFDAAGVRQMRRVVRLK